ncbi:hypothetical protein CN214_16575 [Sinorhizobium meliloti]|nr:hypothetical protein CN214_16575 [Sinorhizobium meliloti]
MKAMVPRNRALRERQAISAAWTGKPGCTKLRHTHERRNLAQMILPRPNLRSKSFEFNSLQCFLNTRVKTTN